MTTNLDEVKKPIKRTPPAYKAISKNLNYRPCKGKMAAIYGIGSNLLWLMVNHIM